MYIVKDDLSEFPLSSLTHKFLYNSSPHSQRVGGNYSPQPGSVLTKIMEMCRNLGNPGPTRIICLLTNKQTINCEPVYASHGLNGTERLAPKRTN